MPYESKWVDPEVAFIIEGVVIFHTYGDADEANDGPSRSWYTTDKHHVAGDDEYEFDIRELDYPSVGLTIDDHPAYVDSSQHPVFQEIQHKRWAAWREYGEPKAEENTIRCAILSGQIKVHPDNAQWVIEAEAAKEQNEGETGPAYPGRVCCDNCDYVGNIDDLGIDQDCGRTLVEVHHLGERLDPGGEVPAGECPECGAFVYLSETVEDFKKDAAAEEPAATVSVPCTVNDISTILHYARIGLDDTDLKQNKLIEALEYSDEDREETKKDWRTLEALEDWCVRNSGQDTGEALRWSVMLHYPRGECDSFDNFDDTFYTFVSAPSREEAVTAAWQECLASNEWDEDKYPEEDFPVLLVLQGAHQGI